MEEVKVQVIQSTSTKLSQALAEMSQTLDAKEAAIGKLNEMLFEARQEIETLKKKRGK